MAPQCETSHRNRMDHVAVRAPGRTDSSTHKMDMSSLTPAPSRQPCRPCGLPVVKALFSCEADTASVLSPITNLAVNMDQLTGLGRFEKAAFDSSYHNGKLPLGRRRSLPKFLGSSPSFKRNLSTSLDCEVFHHGNSENKENEPFQFKMPMRPNFRSFVRYPADGKEGLVQRQKSSPACMFPSPVKDLEIRSCDLPLVRKSSCASTTTEGSDDGFLDMLDADEAEVDSEIPLGVASLLTAPLVMRAPGPCYKARSPTKHLSMTRPALKRMEHSHRDTPEKIKRRRSMCEVTEKSTTVARSKSFCKETIESVFDGDQKDLIGDFSKAFLLPMVSGRHQQLRYITPDVMVQILNGSFDPFIERCVIVDSRYPYEYEGGHIKGAINLHMEQDMEDYFLKCPIQSHSAKRVIVIFHCEFSSERGPRMCKFLREKDRDLHEYPSLYYPELYVLAGGYKDFFQRFPSFCEPENYRPMLHEDFKEDLRLFRLKSRTWAGERSKRELYSRLKKL
ncbi:M-phase inducer phosphatase 1 [Gastrophryne carolinensis]